jgi:hypothetical protein
MSWVKSAFFWLFTHWKAFGVGAIIIAIGRALMWGLNFRLVRAQHRKFKQDLEIQSFAEMILVWTDQQKIIKGTLNLRFADDVLRELLRKDGNRLHIAMNYLEGKGLAKRAAPGYWKIR